MKHINGDAMIDISQFYSVNSLFDVNMYFDIRDEFTNVDFLQDFGF